MSTTNSVPISKTTVAEQEIPAKTTATNEDKNIIKNGKIDTNSNIQETKSNDTKSGSDDKNNSKVDNKRRTPVYRPINNFRGGMRRPRYMENDRRLAWEQEQAKKPVLESGVKGRVKWYSVRFHYGFIARTDTKGNDVFVHQTAIAKSYIKKYYLRTLDDGEDVVFDIVQGKQGPEAANVTGPNGTEVRGSRYHNLQFYGYRRRYFRDRIYPENGRYRRYIPPRRVNEKQEEQDQETQKPIGERRRRFRDFRARRPPQTIKKPTDESEDAEGAGGDSKKESSKPNEMNGCAHGEGRGDARRQINKRNSGNNPGSARRRSANATNTDASHSESDVTDKVKDKKESSVSDTSTAIPSAAVAPTK